MGSGGTGLGPRDVTQHACTPVEYIGFAACVAFFNQQISVDPSVDSTAAQHEGSREQTEQHSSASLTPVERMYPPPKSSDAINEQFGSAPLRTGPTAAAVESDAQSDGLGTRASPFGSEVRRSTPEIQPFEGHEGHTGRLLSSATMASMTNVA